MSLRKKQIFLDIGVFWCNIILMSSIRNEILKQMSSLGLTIYQVSKMVENRIPKRTVYAFLSGEKDTVTETASIFMETLGLKVEVKPDKTKYLKDEKMKQSKPKKLLGRVKAEWERAGRPKWNKRELLAMCLLIDFELKAEGCNPAPTFRKHVESNKYSKAYGWAQGLKFKSWK